MPRLLPARLSAATLALLGLLAAPVAAVAQSATDGGTATLGGQPPPSSDGRGVLPIEMVRGTTELSGWATRTSVASQSIWTGETSGTTTYEVDVKFVPSTPGNCIADLKRDGRDPPQHWWDLCDAAVRNGGLRLIGSVSSGFPPRDERTEFWGTLRDPQAGVSTPFSMAIEGTCIARVNPFRVLRIGYRLTTCGAEGSAAGGGDTDDPSQSSGGEIGRAIDEFFGGGGNGTTQSNAPLRFAMSPGRVRFQGFLTVDGAEAEFDAKFDAQGNLCAADLDAANDPAAEGWRRLCLSADRFGEARIVGTMAPTDGSAAGTGTRRVWEGTVRRRDVGFQADVRAAVEGGCIVAIGLRAVDARYAFRPTACGRERGFDVAQLQDGSGSSDGNGGGGRSSGGGTVVTDTNAGPGGDVAPLAPGGTTDRRNTFGPTPGFAEDLWPEPGNGFLLTFLRNGVGPDPSAPGFQPAGRIALTRDAPGTERIGFLDYSSCPGIGMPGWFCEVARERAGQTLDVADYGFDGRKGVGRIGLDGGRHLVLVLEPDGSGVVRATLLDTRLMVETPLTVNPNGRDPKALRGTDGRLAAVAREDLFPLPGFGHLSAFVDQRMPVPGRPALNVQRGDVVIGGVPIPGQPGGERLAIEDYGACPDGVEAAFCRNAERALGSSAPIEEYRFNGRIGTGRVRLVEDHWLLTRRREDGRIVATLLRVAGESASSLLGAEQTDGGTEIASCDIPSLNPSLPSPPPTHSFSNPTNHEGRPLAFCAATGECADTSPFYANTLCEIAIWESFHRGEIGHPGGLIGELGSGCGVKGGVSRNSARLNLPFESDGQFPYPLVLGYIESAYETGQRPLYGSCTDCTAVALLNCYREEW